MNPAIVWFRNDLRLADNPALQAAATSKRPLVRVYVYDEKTSPGKAPAPRSPGAAARWWLHGSLQGLHNALKERGGELTLLRGATERTLLGLAAELNAGAVYWNRRYDEAGRTPGLQHLGQPPPEQHRSHQLQRPSAARALDDPQPIRQAVPGVHRLLACRAQTGCHRAPAGGTARAEIPPAAHKNNPAMTTPAGARS